MTAATQGTTFRVLDAMDAPYEGRILRLRLQSGEPPSLKALKGGHLRATAPDGRTVTLRVLDFPTFFGKPSTDRLARTGRVDVRVVEEEGEGPVGARWLVSLA